MMCDVDVDEEIWVDVIEWKNQELKPWYKVSNHGRLLRTKKSSSLIMPQTLCSGYPLAQFRTINCTNLNEYTHRLVASLFLHNPDPKIYTEVNHIDGNKCNNHWSNLEWVTHEQNVDHAVRTGLAKGCPGNKVINLTTGQIFDNVSQACRSLGRWNGYVQECIDHDILCTDKRTGQKYQFASLKEG